MSTQQNDQQQDQGQMPTPDPALRVFDQFVGTWTMSGSIEGVEAPAISGEVTFDWMPGGFFLRQHILMDFAGYVQIDSTEFVGYDAATGTFPSKVYSNLSPEPLPYTWKVEGSDVTISVVHAPLDATFHGRFSDDGNTFGGTWTPNPGADPMVNVAYSLTGTRVK